MVPRDDDFHRVRTVEGKEIQVLDEGHLRDLLLMMFKWLVMGGLVSIVGVGIFFARIYDATSDAARDIGEIRKMRAADTAASAARSRAVAELGRQVDSLRIVFTLVQPEITDLGEDVRALRRALRQPR